MTEITTNNNMSESPQSYSAETSELTVNQQLNIRLFKDALNALVASGHGDEAVNLAVATMRHLYARESLLMQQLKKGWGL